MESETQTSGNLNVIDVIKKISTIKPVPLIDLSEKSKSVFPYIEFYRKSKQAKEKIPTLSTNFNQKLLSLNKKIKEKESAHFHHQTLNPNDSPQSISINSGIFISSRKSKYLNMKNPLCKSFNMRKKESEFKDLLVLGIKKSKRVKEILPSNLKLPSIAELLVNEK